MGKHNVTASLIRFGLLEGWASEIEWEDLRPGQTVFVDGAKKVFVGVRSGRGGPPQPVVRGLGERDHEERLQRSRHPLAIVVPVRSGEDISLDVPFKPAR